MSVKAVQFRGIDDVVNAYERRNALGWSLWYEKQFLFPCMPATITEGSEMLQGYLEKIKESRTAAIYRLQVYEDLPEGEKIKDKTPCDGSFNFLLNDPMDDAGYMEKSVLGRRLKLIEEKLSGPPVPEPTLYDKIMDFCETDTGRAILGHVLGTIFKVPQNIAGNRIAGIPDDNKIKEAIEILKKYDDGLGDHLFKLAQIAQGNPQLFKTIMGSLDKM